MMVTDPIVVQILDAPLEWNDYITLFTNLLGPLLAAFFGVWILIITKKIEHSQWRNQKLIEKRISVWDDVAPKINDIYCYCMRVGDWKQHTPERIIEIKREVDKSIHTYRPYFSPKFFECFMDFMNVCFATYQGHGVDAKIKSPLTEHKTAHGTWNQSWDNYFYKTPSQNKEINKKYLCFQQQLSHELNVESTAK